MKALLLKLLKKYFRKSDKNRWANIANLSSGWDSRTEIIGGLIPDSTSVLEFGSGREVLKKYLKTNCRYTPSDITKRSNDTIVCDLNRKFLPEFEFHDYIVFSGVLEYIFNVPGLIAKISVSCDHIIASYAIHDSSMTQLNRIKQGWVNNYSIDEFEKVFTRLKFDCIFRKVWRNQIIFSFKKRSEK